VAKKLPPGFDGQRYIEIVVGEDGKTSIEVHNFRGAGCHEATKGLEQALGTVSKRKDKGGPDVKQTVRAG